MVYDRALISYSSIVIPTLTSHSFIHSIIHSFNHSFIHAFIHSFIHSFSSLFFYHFQTYNNIVQHAVISKSKFLISFDNIVYTIKMYSSYMFSKLFILSRYQFIYNSGDSFHHSIALNFHQLISREGYPNSNKLRRGGGGGVQYPLHI